MAIIKLKNVCEIKVGKDIRVYNDNKNFVNNSNIGYLNIRDFMNNPSFRITNFSKYIVPSLKIDSIYENCLICVRTGETAGNFKLLINKCVLDNRWNILIPNKNILLIYLLYCSQKFKYKLFEKNIFTTQPNITQKMLENLEINLPSIKVQQQIIDIIEPFEKILYNFKLKLNKINNILICLYKTLSIDNLISINKIIKVNFNKYDEQKYYYDTSTISTSKIGIPELISFNKKSRANLTPEKNSIIISKLIGENKIFPIFTNFYDNSVFSTGFLNFSCKYSAYVYGYMLTNEFINIKKSTMSGSVMASINNKSINNWQINDINIKKWDNKFDNLLILINYYNSLILKINNVIKKIIDLYII